MVVLSYYQGARYTQATTQYALFPLPPSSALVGISVGPETEEKMERVAKESMRLSGEGVNRKGGFAECLDLKGA